MDNQDELNNLDISSTMKSQIKAECKKAESAEEAVTTYNTKSLKLKQRRDNLDFNNELARINAFMQL